MFKKSANPKIEELTKSCTLRQYSVGNINHVIRLDGSKGCVWCGDPLKNNHPARRYCSDVNCKHSIYAWGYPQKENGLWELLARQDFCCKICGYDYKPFIDDTLIGKYYGLKNKNKVDYRSHFNYYVVKLLKRVIDKAWKPEVDHIVPVSKGGASLGLDNHQAICSSCHKTKTKIDNSGPRRKRNG